MNNWAKRRLPLAVLVLFLTSCINKGNFKEEERKATNESFVKIEIDYAKGFKVDYFKGGKFVQVLHPKSGAVLDEFLLIANENAEIPDSLARHKSFKVALNRVASQSTTHISFFDRLQVLNHLQAVAFADLVRNQNAKIKIDAGEIQNLTKGNRMNEELLIDLSPDLIFMYPFDQNAVKNIKEHVPTVLTTEYLELSPLAKAEWIKFFALFFNQEQKADSLFNQIVKSYEEEINEFKNESLFFLNLPYNGIWDCPPGNSYSVALIEDAGLKYQYADNLQNENLQKTMEEILDECLETPFWIIIAQRNSGFDLDDLKSENHLYSEFRAVKEKNVILCNTLVSDYFGDALLEPQILLKNLKAVIQGETDSTRFFYRLQ